VSDVRTLSRNTAARYAAHSVELLVGFLLLPYNITHLGTADYGLWILAASFARYVGVLDLGLGGGLTRFVAECRARGEARRLSELVSSVMVAFAAVGVLAFLVLGGVALLYGRIFSVDPREASVGRTVLLLIAARVALGFPLSVFGAVTSGAQRYALNNTVGVVVALLEAAANVWVIESGGGVIAVVAAKTLVQIAAYGAFAVNAYRVQPGLQVSPRLASRARLREVGSFSVYILGLSVAHKVNYSLDNLVIGMALGPTAVALFTPAVRVAQAMRDLAGQFHDVLFPAVVDLGTRGERERLRTLLVEGTRASTALVLAVSIGVIVLAGPILTAWVGPALAGSAPVLQVLAVSMVARIVQATAGTVLKGAGGHRYLLANNAVVALFNLLLSLALVWPLGLLGVALGTAVPVAAGVLFVVPEACRRLSLPVGRLLREGLWPVVWPALPVAAALRAWRGAVDPQGLVAVLAAGAAAGALYLALVYAVGLGPAERAMVRARLRAAVGPAGSARPGAARPRGRLAPSAPRGAAGGPRG
jgi:O-antigen/teichoic acid export membrane protein